MEVAHLEPRRRSWFDFEDEAFLRLQGELRAVWLTCPSLDRKEHREGCRSLAWSAQAEARLPQSFWFYPSANRNLDQGSRNPE